MDGSNGPPDETGLAITSISFSDDPGPGDDATYGAGDSILVEVAFNEGAVVTGIPQVELDIGGNAR